MIAMQYSFTLPADYDMSIIDRRIHDKGPMLDGFPLLRFKAYLSARKEGGDVSSAENLYAPFYLWDEPEGLNNFLTGAGFAGVARDFGWPSVRTWIVWHAELGPDLAEARFASRTIETIAPYSDLSALRSHAVSEAKDDVKNGALASVVAFDPTGWALIRFRLWLTPPPAKTADGQLYDVGHVSTP
jgi:hypothetical protein